MHVFILGGNLWYDGGGKSDSLCLRLNVLKYSEFPSALNWHCSHSLVLIVVLGRSTLVSIFLPPLLDHALANECIWKAVLDGTYEVLEPPWPLPLGHGLDTIIMFSRSNGTCPFWILATCKWSATTALPFDTVFIGPLDSKGVRSESLELPRPFCTPRIPCVRAKRLTESLFIREAIAKDTQLHWRMVKQKIMRASIPNKAKPNYPKINIII